MGSMHYPSIPSVLLLNSYRGAPDGLPPCVPKSRGGSDVENGLVNAERLSRVVPRSFPNNPRAQALVRFPKHEIV